MPLSNCPNVSVIVPVYNDDTGARACLEMLRKQTYPMSKFEVILVDNGSDPPLEFNVDYPFKLRIQRCLIPGSYAARNAGAGSAGGTILAFTDADCLPSPDWIQEGVAALAAGDGQIIIGGEVRMLEPKSRTGVALYQYATGFHQKDNIQQKGFAITANLFCTIQQFQSVGQFDDTLLSGGDREWAWRAAQRGLRVHFESKAAVSTHPRNSLSAAIRQARRTAAGRFYLRRYALDYGHRENLAPHRSMLTAIIWILTRRQYSIRERISVLYAATLIKIASLVENVRLRLGSSPERR